MKKLSIIAALLFAFGTVTFAQQAKTDKKETKKTEKKGTAKKTEKKSSTKKMDKKSSDKKATGTK